MIRDSIVNFVYRIATSGKRSRILATFWGALLFSVLTLPFIFLPLYVDKYLSLPPFLSKPWNVVVSLPLMLIGALLMLWSMFVFARVKGTPVPFNPPPKLVTTGPFAYSRNPMTIGLFILMFGIGFYFSSITSVIIFTPLYIYLNILEFKYIEEPELEKRLGQDYVEYKKKVKLIGFRAKN